MVNYLEILNETMNENADFGRMAEIIKRDFSLTYKLLRLINSPAFYTVQEITSVNQALTLLGLNEIRKWTTLIMLRDISAEKPDELVKVSLVRALFAEHLADLFGLKNRKTEAFLLGLFSLIDTIMDKPLFDIVEPLPLKSDVKAAMMGVGNPFHDILVVLRHYEVGDFDRVMRVTESRKISNSDVSDYYIKAVEEAARLYLAM
jgi:EAL and modified HD-GYP domain-containing signal transduction protein